MDLSVEDEGQIVEGWSELAREWDRPVHVVPFWSDDESWFSWDSCDICDAPAGERHVVAVLEA
jgi:hypothetical protein